MWLLGCLWWKCACFTTVLLSATARVLALVLRLALSKTQPATILSTFFDGDRWNIHLLDACLFLLCVVDIFCYRLKNFLNSCSRFCTDKLQLAIVFAAVGLGFLVAHSLWLYQVLFVPHDQQRIVFARLLDLIHPEWDRFKWHSICDIIHNDDSGRISVVKCCQRTEPLLSGRVANGHGNLCLVLHANRRVLKIYAWWGDTIQLELLLDEIVDNRRLPHAAVSQQTNFIFLDLARGMGWRLFHKSESQWASTPS